MGRRVDGRERIVSTEVTAVMEQRPRSSGEEENINLGKRFLAPGEIFGV